VRLAGDETTRPARLIVVAATMSVTFLAGGTLGAHPSVVIGLFVLMNFAMGALDPLTRSWLNEQIGESDRATLLSFHSTFATVGGSLGLLAVGAYADRAGIPASWQVSSMISLGMIACYWILLRRGRAPAIIPVPAPE
jgi:MFS family permease